MGVSFLQATVYLLEKLDVLLLKASEEETKSEILPMIFSTLESNSIQGQVRHLNYINLSITLVFGILLHIQNPSVYSTNCLLD